MGLEGVSATGSSLLLWFCNYIGLLVPPTPFPSVPRGPFLSASRPPTQTLWPYRGAILSICVSSVRVPVVSTRVIAAASPAAARCGGFDDVVVRSVVSSSPALLPSLRLPCAPSSVLSVVAATRPPTAAAAETTPHYRTSSRTTAPCGWRVAFQKAMPVVALLLSRSSPDPQRAFLPISALFAVPASPRFLCPLLPDDAGDILPPCGVHRVEGTGGPSWLVRR